MRNILHESVAIIQEKFIPAVSKKHLHLFRFGIAALTLSPFRSLNSNARVAVKNTNTAYTKMYRLTKQKKLLSVFPAIMKSFLFVKPESVVAIDFSTFCGFQVLTFAVQTHVGRAIPVYFEVITYTIEKETSQNIFIEQACRHLGEILGFYPRFVLDRGFAIPSLITFFMKEQIIFYVRCKASKHVLMPKADGTEQSLKISKIKQFDQHVLVYDKILRLVISNKPAKNKEPWYLFTNDFDSSRKAIIKIYYYRFEIEETFRDLKHIYDLRAFQIKQVQSFSLVLWFVIAGVWLSFSIEEVKLQLKTSLSKNMHKKLSIVRLWSEGIQRSFLYSFLNTSYMEQFF